MSSLQDDLQNIVFNDFKLGELVAISMPAANWAMILEWLSTVEDKGNAAMRLGNLIWIALTPEHYRQALEAKRAEINPFTEHANKLREAFGQDADIQVLGMDELTEQMRCLVCGRVPNKITAPCDSCPDFLERGFDGSAEG